MSSSDETYIRDNAYKAASRSSKISDGAFEFDPLTSIPRACQLIESCRTITSALKHTQPFDLWLSLLAVCAGLWCGKRIFLSPSPDSSSNYRPFPIITFYRCGVGHFFCPVGGSTTACPDRIWFGDRRVELHRVQSRSLTHNAQDTVKSTWL